MTSFAVRRAPLPSLASAEKLTERLPTSAGLNEAPLCECGKLATLSCEDCARVGGFNLCDGCHGAPFQKRHATAAPRRVGRADVDGMCAKHRERLHFVCDWTVCLVCQHAPEHKVGNGSLAGSCVCVCICAYVCSCFVQGHAVTQLSERVEAAHGALRTEMDKLVAQIVRQRASLPAVRATRASVEQVPLLILRG